MSNEQFISQTAQFSSLEQMQTMNSNLQTFIESQGKVGKTSALSLVGKNVVIDKSAFSLSSDTESASLSYNLTAEATATLTVYDSSNKAIKNVNLGKQSAGTHNYLWNGKTNESISAGKGEYSYKISAKDVNGNNISTDEMVSGLIDGISFEGNETFLNISGSSFPLSSLVKVLPSSTGE
jgi:flagellar basal-body rod modification protein FlgD